MADTKPKTGAVPVTPTASGPLLAARAPEQTKPPTGAIPTDPFHTDPFVGRTVGHCRLLEKIAEGGSSLIYRALNVNFNLERVVKILKPSLSEDQEYYERFKQEAQLTARLDHPNVLRIFDTGELILAPGPNGEGGRQFFIEMEYVGGETLRSFLNRHHRVREVDILGIAGQITQALEYAHNVHFEGPDGEALQGILHRDIKPENIMLTPGGGLKLMDFGAAKPLSLNHKTLQGTIVGTPHYMSPEQISGESLDARSDFFSLGIVFYEMCTGHRPFDSENLATLLWNIDACKYEPPRKLRASLSPLTEELIERLLTKNPDQRPSSAKEIHETLQVAQRTLQQWGSGSRAKVPFSFRRFFPVAALAFSAFALAISGFLAFRFFPLLRNPGELRAHFSALVGKGLEAERKGDVDGALGLYDLTPAPDKGGDPESYLLSRLRSARIMMNKGQLTKARSLLEGLSRKYRDPALDAYLGILYFKSALYLEAKDRLEAALGSDHQTVLRRSDDFNPEEFRGEALYHLAQAWNGQFAYVDPKPEFRAQAIKALRRFLEYTCSTKDQDPRCEQSRRRLEEL